MYKTVRHGENSLQYKILAQQEEGLTNVRCRKPSRAVTLKLLTVVILLIVGIIASAVLVPLLLTNDFFTLTGTFQKFSVSTLRRTHSGNHVVVIAKKPFGWNAPHPSASPKTSNASQNHPTDSRIAYPPSTTPATSTIRSTLKTTALKTSTRRTSPRPPEETTRASFEKEEATVAGGGKRDEGVKSTTEGRKSFRADGGSVSSTSTPNWFQPIEKWQFRPPEINTWMQSGLGYNPLYIFVGGCALFLVIVILMFFVLRKTISGRRPVTEKETGESKEDSARLLKPSARGSDEE